MGKNRRILIFLLLFSAFISSSFAAPEAKEILTATGIKGGLIVHIGCDEGHFTASLRVNDSYLVHGLDTNSESIRMARRNHRALGLEGKVSVAVFDGRHLPYIDNIVNLVVGEDLGDVSMDEVMRVLAPEGVAYIKLNGTWIKTTKTRPADIDEWTHYLYDASNNAVADDRVVSMPYHIQWVDDPMWARHHNHLSTTSAMVTSGGRLFAIVDKGPTVSLKQSAGWTLIARDAFNGVLLWEKPIGPWADVLRRFRSGPLELSRRLVAVSDRVFVTLGYGKPVTVLDAATGTILKTYAGTEGTVEILHQDDILYLVKGVIGNSEGRQKNPFIPPPRRKRILAVHAGNGELLWQKSDVDTYELMPTTLCIDRDRVFFQSISHVVCLDKKSGDVLWRTRRPASLNRMSWSTPTLVVHDDVVLSADSIVPDEDQQPNPDTTVEWTVTSKTRTQEKFTGELIAFSATNGNELWRCKAGQGYNAPADVFVVNGLVWASSMPGRNTVDLTEGRDLHTGQVRRRIDTSAAFTTTHHHRCYRNKATDQFIFLGRTGVEFIDLKGETPQRHCWIRGACQYGVLPANGLLYLPPHACACYIQSKLSGFWALAPARQMSEDRNQKSIRLEKGQAYKAISNLKFEILNQNDWPMFRHDVGRTSRVDFAIPLNVKSLWDINLSGSLTSPVIAAGVVCVASVDTHTVYTVDAETGEQLWNYTVGGRIDSPPTIYNGLVIFGSADGFVYCLRLSDGALVWRFRAAPRDLRTVAFGQIESVWPVTGSVMVHDDVVYCTTGRSSYLDGGMILYRLDPTTGKLLGEKRFYSRNPKTGEQPEAIIEDVELPGALPDVLVYDGENLYLRSKCMDLSGNERPKTRAHLYSSAGLLDDNWWHRTYWIWGDRHWGRASGWAVASRYRPSGRILVSDEETVFGYGRKNVSGNSLAGYQLFRAEKKVEVVNRKIKNNNLAVMKYQTPDIVNHLWAHEIPVVGRAMVLADNAVYVAGPVMEFGAEEPRFDDADSPAVLMAFDIEDGAELARKALDTQPVFDGMAAARGRLYISTIDGTIVCLGESFP